jgi:ribonucleoside-diphosphate reductase beta chain
VIGHLRRDEARHIAYGIYLLSRLLAENGEPAWNAIEARLNQLLQPALAIIAEVFAAYPEPPFGLRMEEFTDFALDQFSRRVARLERARRETPQQVAAAALENEEEER